MRRLERRERVSQSTATTCIGWSLRELLSRANSSLVRIIPVLRIVLTNNYRCILHKLKIRQSRRFTPTELNSLELQFLLLNDFRLRVSVEEMQRYGDRLLAYAEEAGEDIGTIGVERRRNDASEWGEFEGRHGERGFEGRAFRESSGGGDSRSTRPTVEEANSASPSTTTRNPVSAASAKASLPNPVSIKYANTQPPLPLISLPTPSLFPPRRE